MRTWDDYEQGCLTSFGGGYRTEEEREIFRHGMSTVFNLLRGEFPPAEIIRNESDLLTFTPEEFKRFVRSAYVDGFTDAYAGPNDTDDAAVRERGDAGFERSLAASYAEKALKTYRSIPPIPIVLCSQRMPEVNEIVIVAGGIAYWTGENWRTPLDHGNVIQWKVNWWAPLPTETGGIE
jgi:hypothetical protein